MKAALDPMATFTSQLQPCVSRASHMSDWVRDSQVLKAIMDVGGKCKLSFQPMCSGIDFGTDHHCSYWGLCLCLFVTVLTASLTVSLQMYDHAHSFQGIAFEQCMQGGCLEI